jgi:hypothetical protein
MGQFCVWTALAVESSPLTCLDANSPCDFRRDILVSGQYCPRGCDM